MCSRSARLQVALSEVFQTFVGGCFSDTASASEPPFLPREGVEAWLLKINRALGRGSEFRAAEAIMGPGPGGGLTLEGAHITEGGKSFFTGSAKILSGLII